jgi:hypothetical protein
VVPETKGVSGDLDAFLKGGNPEDSGGTPPPAAPAAKPDGETVDKGASQQNPKEDAERQQAAAPAKPTTPEPDDDTEPGDPEPGQAIVPRTAYEQERKRRQDWKSRADKAETERDMLARQLEEAKKGPPPQSTPPPQLDPIDPVRDPEGYTRRVRGVVLNERLNTSEMMALDKHGKEVIDAETAYFQKRTQADPRLWNELYSKPHPYQWMIDSNAMARLHEEIGTDPAAYRAKIIAEEKAKWETENGAGGQRVSPAAGLPPSLASARSAAPRGTNGFAGPPSMDDILRRPERKR